MNVTVYGTATRDGKPGVLLVLGGGHPAKHLSVEDARDLAALLRGSGVGALGSLPAMLDAGVREAIELCAQLAAEGHA